MVQFLLRSCSIVTVLKRALSRKQNIRRNCKEKNSRSGKSNFFTGFRDVADFFTGNRDLIHPWWAPVNAKATKYTHCFAIFNSFALITLMHINMRKEIQSDKANKVVLLCFGRYWTYFRAWKRELDGKATWLREWSIWNPAWLGKLEVNMNFRQFLGVICGSTCVKAGFKAALGGPTHSNF